MAVTGPERVCRAYLFIVRISHLLFPLLFLCLFLHYSAFLCLSLPFSALSGPSGPICFFTERALPHPTSPYRAIFSIRVPW